MLERVSTQDGTWNDLTLQWERQCNDFGEDFSEYAMASMPVVEGLASAPQRADAAVFAAKKQEEFLAACQLNSTFLPGYKGKVLRVRHIVLAPKYDFGEVDIHDYQEVLVATFLGALFAADRDMPSDHIKFHLRSPAELSFGGAFTEVLSESKKFKRCDMRGSWIYISKT